MNNYQENLLAIEHNLELVRRCLAAYPEMFDAAGDQPVLVGEPPIVTHFTWGSCSEDKRALAKSHQEANWTRRINRWNRRMADYVGHLAGVCFVLECAEELPEQTVEPFVEFRLSPDEVDDLAGFPRPSPYQAIGDQSI